MNKKVFKYIIFEAFILFMTVFPAVLTGFDAIISAAVFSVTAFLLNIAVFAAFGQIFKNIDKSAWLILFCFAVLSLISNLFLSIHATFPFLTASLVTVFAKNTAAFRKLAEKNNTEAKIYPQIILFAVVTAAYTVLYAVSGVTL